MRNLYIYTIVLLLLSASCTELLDVEADNTISGNDVLSNPESIQQALTGAYYNFTGISNGAEGGELIGGDFIIIPELLARVSGTPSEYRWEIVLTPTAYRDFINKDILETNGRVQANWQRAYETINLLNNIIANIDNVSGNDKNRIHGEALAMRGILYFEMALLWGPQYDAPGVDPASARVIPIRTEPITDINEIPALSSSDVNTLMEVYQQAEDDLTTASSLLESYGKNDTGLSYYACQAYLAKLSLQKAEYNAAEAYADEVISSGQYSLVANSLLAFNNTSNSSEDIYAIQQNLANNVGDRSTGQGLTAYYSSLEESGLGVYGLIRSVLNSSSWLNSPLYAETDIRGSIDQDVDSTTVNTEITTAYYRNLANNDPSLLSTSKYTSSQYVLPVLRLAELYLIRAEANYFKLNSSITQQAIDDLNAIRTRAGIGAIPNGFSDPDAFFDSLVVERTREFMHEGMLLEDLRRWGGFVGRATGLQFDPWDEEFILPIPRSEQDTWTD